ncbi:ankyrin repeat-containing domain protein [Jimgerdemannia flammicorona]|uniref:Ankyrin repeat-containing domain protein n=1 Tax=Jimgerdemannia flammicorona TaxID=994334 RepID=A0A433DLL7_9FUNG|nr:ankyrin repeat-containing domain protein [Jimgerdemannia flammicorona]
MAANLKERTPLHSAVNYGHVEVVKQLLHKNADVNSSHVEIAKLVLTRAPDDGNSPLHLALYVDLAKLLDKGADVHAENDPIALDLAEGLGHAVFAELLLEQDADVNAKEDDDRTPLHWSQNGHVERLKLLTRAPTKATSWSQKLIGSGAKVNAKNNRNFTPLSLATTCYHDEIAKLLIDNGGSY